MSLHTEGLYLVSGSNRTFRFDDRAEKLLLGRFGFGMPPVSNRTRRAPYQQGESFISATVTPRVINLTTAMIQCTRRELFLLRQELLRTASPFASNCDHPMKLVWIWPGNGGKYYLNVYYSTGLEMNTASGPTPLMQNTGIQLIGYDPFWYEWDEEEETYSCGVTAGSHCGMPVPDPDCFYMLQANCMLCLPCAFGGETVDETLDCVNAGDVPVDPVLYFYGEFKYPRAENIDTGEYIYWDNTVPSGKTLVIDCKEKTVELDGVDVISYKEGNFIDLRPHDMPEGQGVTDGLNHIWVTGRVVCGCSDSVAIKWRNAYIGY